MRKTGDTWMWLLMGAMLLGGVGGVIRKRAARGKKMSLSPRVLAWAQAVRAKAPDLPLGAVLMWFQLESGGRRNLSTRAQAQKKRAAGQKTPEGRPWPVPPPDRDERGLAQIHAQEARTLGWRPGPTWDALMADDDVAVATALDYIRHYETAARRFVADLGSDWGSWYPRDQWAALKLMHAGPGWVAWFVARTTLDGRALRPALRSWDAFRERADEMIDSAKSIVGKAPTAKRRAKAHRILLNATRVGDAAGLEVA
jgi:hypothetical protein